jgi:hypothetical protein
MIKRLLKQAGLIAALFTCISMLNTVHAAGVPVDLNYDLTTGGTESNAGNTDSIGNIWSYTQTADSTDYTIEITAWAMAGATDPFAAATVIDVGAFNSDPALGLGVCNVGEMPIDSVCKKKNSSKVIMDNKQEFDWLLILLPESMTINSFEVTPDGSEVRSVTYFTGNINAAGDISGLTPTTLPAFTNGAGFDTQQDVSLAKSNAAATVNVTGTGYRNVLLVGASLTDNNASITLTNLNVSTVPVPAAVWLFGSALAGLALRRKQKRVH